MRILVTNDDGVHSPGLHALAVGLSDAGHDVVVVAPHEERSGASASIGALFDGTELVVTAHPVHGSERVLAHGLDGPPALCVLVSMLEVFGARPDIVVSGINLGNNCGRSVLQSGTVGAALIAQNFGLSALAVSIDDPAISDADPDTPPRWLTAASVASAAVQWLAGADRKTVINVNVPNRPIDDLAGVRWARLAAFGTNTTSVEGEVPGTLRVRIAPRDVELAADTDTRLVHEGFVTITGLTGIRAEFERSAAAAPAIQQWLTRGTPGS